VHHLVVGVVVASQPLMLDQTVVEVVMPEVVQQLPELLVLRQEELVETALFLLCFKRFPVVREAVVLETPMVLVVRVEMVAEELEVEAEAHLSTVLHPVLVVMVVMDLWRLLRCTD
jgi:hypothetical protein